MTSSAADITDSVHVAHRLLKVGVKGECLLTSLQKLVELTRMGL